MKIFTKRKWRGVLAAQRLALDVARNNKLSDWERTDLDRLRQLADELWESHSKPYPDGHPGDSGFGQEWWCSGCRTQWPCKTAKAVMAAKGFEYEYAPMRIPIRGEKRVKDGIELGVGHWMRVQGVEPDRCPECHPLAEEAS